jgi:hypothetical protein
VETIGDDRRCRPDDCALDLTRAAREDQLSGERAQQCLGDGVSPQRT